jgi:2-haloacid dehalogenase
MAHETVKALLFDVFGTVVDWRTSIIREGAAFGRAHGIEGVDWTEFADAWRGLYQPTLEKVRSGGMPFQQLDDLHRQSLDRLLAERNVAKLPEAALDHLNRAWHRLDPWPDALPGLQRMKRKYILATCSNGNVALMVNLAKHAGLPWDAILGAEPAGQFKPLPVVYLTTAKWLRLKPEECVMVAAHRSDLAAAAACGLKTGYVPRPLEYGPKRAKKPDAEPPRAKVERAESFDFEGKDFIELAERLGC